MKLIIDIDEEIYKSIKIGMRNRDDMAEIGEAVENGIPLDDLRAEIADLADSDAYGDYQQGFNFGLMRAAQIIDKYRNEVSK